jgi:hypothetical protein
MKFSGMSYSFAKSEGVAIVSFTPPNATRFLENQGIASIKQRSKEVIAVSGRSPTGNVNNIP